MGNLKVVQDFLPSPDELAFKEETVEVTIALSRRSVDFLKNRRATTKRNIKNCSAAD